MKKIIVVYILFFLSSLSYAMSHNSWINCQYGFFSKCNDKTLSESKVACVPFVMVKSSNALNKECFFLIVLYLDGERKIYDSCLGGLVHVCENLPLKIPEYSPTDYYLLAFEHAYSFDNAANKLAKLLAYIKKNYQRSTIATYAFGESAHVVNLATRKFEKDFKSHQDRSFVIDTIIHVQSPIYEYSRTTFTRAYEYHEEDSPTGFRRLYNLYTKSEFPFSYINKIKFYVYPERKYRQQVLKGNIQEPATLMRVQNIRMFNLDTEGQLVDLPVLDIKNDKFLYQLICLINECSDYQVNFDLIAQVFNKSNEKELPKVMISRLVTQEGEKLFFRYGNKKDQSYELALLRYPGPFSHQMKIEYQLSNNRLKYFVEKWEKNKDDLSRIITEHKEYSYDSIVSCS